MTVILDSPDGLTYERGTAHIFKMPRKQPDHPLPPLGSCPWGQELLEHEREKELLTSGRAAPAPEVLK